MTEGRPVTGAGRRIRAVVFDLDGTLVDTMALVPRAYAETIRALGGPAVFPDEVVAAWHVGPTPVVLGHFLGRAATTDDVEHYFARFTAAADDIRPFPGVPEMLDALRAAAYVGDAEVDLRCARAAGSLGIHASWSAAALPGSHPVARRPADVVDLLPKRTD